MFWILAIASLIAMLDVTGFKLDEETQNIIYSENSEDVPDANKDDIEIKEKKPSKPRGKSNKSKAKLDMEKKPNLQPDETEVELEIDTDDLEEEAVGFLKELY